MSRNKADLAYVTLNQLSTLTGMTYRTLKKKLADVDPAEDEEGNTLLYRPAEVLPVIYGVVNAEGAEIQAETKSYDIWKERARLAKFQADKAEIEVNTLRGNLIPAEQIEVSWSKMVSAFRSRILGIPAKLAIRAAAEGEVKVVEQMLKTECNEALSELSQYDPRDAGRQDLEEGGEISSSSSESDDQPVG